MRQNTNALLRITLSLLFMLALSLEGLFAQTPSLVKDIASGTTSSTPGLFLTFNNKLYFTASQGTGVNGGTRWFSTDGTNAGTYGISTPTSSGNFSPGSNTATSITTYNGSLYFSGATNGVADIELYKMTTGESISLIKDINSGTLGSSPGYLTVFNSKLYFSATDGTASGNHGKELWVSDGTTSGTTLVSDINTVVSGSATASSNPANLTVVSASNSKNYLLFSATDGSTGALHGTELWQLTDASGATPSLVYDINSGTGNSTPANFTVFNNKLYFTATPDGTNTRVWVYDPAVSASSTNPSQLNTTLTAASGLTVVGSNLYFVGTASGTTSLWKSDGTAANTAATSVTTPTSLVNSNGTLFYVNSTDFQVYTYNGTSATKLTTTLTASPTLTAASNNLVYFAGTDANAQPWVSDGTTAGTFRLGIINSSAASNPASFYYFNGMVYFRASNGTTGSLTGSELYKYGYNTWTGATSSSFSTASNWSAGFVPDSTTDVKIPSVARMPSLTGTNTIRGLNVPSGVILTNTGTLQVGGDLVNNGTVTGSGTLQLNGTQHQAINGLSTTAQSISGTGTINNLTLPTYNSNGSPNAYTNGATITGGMQSLTGTLLVQAGTLTTGGFLTLKSTSIANSAVVDQVSGSISGNVVVERYIPAGYRGYRDLAPQVYNATSTTGSIFKNWQENGSFSNSGYGIFITGNGATDATKADYSSGQIAPNSSNGLDYSLLGNPSAFTFKNANGSWYSQYVAGQIDSIWNTKTTNLDVFTGYRVLVRGDRSFNLATTPILNYPAGLRMYNATTIRATGSLVTGNVIYNTSNVTGTSNGSGITSTNALNPAATTFVTINGKSYIATGLSMVANPYACPVSWSSVYNASVAASGSSAVAISATYYSLNPTYSATGSYDAYNKSTGSSDNPADGSQASDLIQAGQAFFVLNATASPVPIVKFTEATKMASSAKTYVFGTTAPLSKLYFSLLKSTTNGFVRTDGVAAAFRSDFTGKTVGPQDALKLRSGSDMIAIIDKDVALSIDGRLPATANDAIALRIDEPSDTVYQLKIDATAYNNEGLSPQLFDAYKNTTTALGTGITIVDFKVDAKTAASYANRFSIIFTPSALAVNSIVASASLNNKIATITWNTVGEKGESYYEVEKSTDGKNFNSIGQQAAKNIASASYSTTDNSVVSGNNYYRIKAVSATGAVNYSNIAKLTTNHSQLITVYPNPLVGKTLNVSLSNVNAGKYVVSIYNVLGQKVAEQAIIHNGGSASHAITVNNTLAAGTYKVVIHAEGSNQIVHQTSLSVQP